SCLYLFSLCPRRPPTSSLFPYTTLFRSSVDSALGQTRLAQDRARADRRQVVAVQRDVQGADRRALALRALDLVGNALGELHAPRSEEHTSELQSRENLVCRLLLEKKKNE